LASTLPPPPRTLRDHLTLESPGATRGYWAGVGLVAASMYVPRLLPCVDYPQHLGLADMARRLSDPSAPEHKTHVFNAFTYNGLFHVVVSRLGKVMPIELAGRTVVAFSLLLLGAACLALLKVLRRPASYAALTTPFLFSFALGWGFVNYTLGTALAVTTCVFIATSLQRLRWWSLLGTFVVGLLCGMTHVLATILLCILAVALAPEISLRSVEAESLLGRLGKAFLRCFAALSPLLGTAIWCVAVAIQQYKWNPGVYKDPTLEGTSPPIWQKLAYFCSWATGAHSDLTDQMLTFLCLVVLVGAMGLGLYRLARKQPWDGPTDPDEDRPAPPLVLPFVAMMTAYLLTPMVFIGTHLIFPRLTQLVAITAVLAAPRYSARLWPNVRFTARTLGVLAGINLFVHAAIFARETDDASKIIDLLPPGRRATAVIYDGSSFAFRNGSLAHLAAYYGARKQGEWAFSFARYLSVPVRFKAGGNPWWPQRGWEFGPREYNPRCHYARYFPLVIVKAPNGLPTDASAEQAVRELVFMRDANAVKLLGHVGHYWAFDSEGLPEDGTY